MKINSSDLHTGGQRSIQILPEPLPGIHRPMFLFSGSMPEGRCLCRLLLVICTHPFVKKELTLHLARSEGRERYFGCNLMHRKVLASSHQHLMAEAPSSKPAVYTAHPRDHPTGTLYGALNYSHGLSKGPSFGTGRGLEFVCIFGHDGHAAAPLGFFQTDRGFVVGDSPTGCESIIEQRTHRVACLPPAALSTRNQILSLARI